MSEGRYLVVGFGLVTFLLLAVGVTGWVVLSGQSRSFERYNAAGDLLSLMDDARLAELTFTRDETRASVEATMSITLEVLNRARELKNLVGDDARRQRLDQVTTATERYRDLFSSYVALRQQSRQDREAMVQAAMRASDSADGLQRIQEKYIRLDTESLRAFRRQMERISENSANSYEIVIFVEQARDNEKDFLLSRSLKELELARSNIAKLSGISNQLKQRIDDPRSLALLARIDSEKDVYLAAIANLEETYTKDRKFDLNSPEVLDLDRAAFAMRDTAFALRSNERAVLSQIQQKVADTQELMARRLSLSEEVNHILIDVGTARQSDRDFSLATTDEGRRVHAERVTSLLRDVTNRILKIQQLLIEDDEKKVFESMLPSIDRYHENFTQAVDVALKASQTGRALVETALAADTHLNAAQASRLTDIAAAREWADVLAPMGITFGIGIVLLALLMRKAQQKLAAAYGVISSSIDYASNIQRSLLPHEEDFTSAFAEYFVIWEPRDRVGGDIYWSRMWGDGVLVVLGDCTGHGVPGAFMSLIANSALERATEEADQGDVAGLLQKMHQHIQLTLRQHLKEGIFDDGLEVGACYLGPDRKRIAFAGARFSLFFNDPLSDAEIREIKGDKIGIGFRSTKFDQSFKQKDVEVLPRRAFYLASDGIIDQIGGPRRRSFGKRRFRELLFDIQDKPMSKQRLSIWKALEEYQGEEIRRDDVSVIGFRVG